MAAVAKIIVDWRKAVATDKEGLDDANFNSNFDPAVVVDNALTISANGVKGVHLTELPAVDKDLLQNQFEKGWLVAWIKIAKFTHVPFARDKTRDKLLACGRHLAVANIDALVDQYCPTEGNTMFPPGVMAH